MQDGSSSGARTAVLWVLGILLVGGVLCCGGLGFFTYRLREEMGTSIQGSGIPAMETRSVPSFRGVDAGGALRVEIQRGDTFEVIVEGDDNLVPLVETTVLGDELQLSTPFSYSPELDLIVRIRMPELDSLELDGAAEATVVDVRAARLEIDLEDAAECTVQGQVEDLDLDASQAADADLSQLAVRRARVRASDAAEVRVSASETLEIEADGSADVTHSGAAQVKVEKRAAATVTRE